MFRAATDLVSVGPALLHYGAEVGFRPHRACLGGAPASALRGAASLRSPGTRPGGEEGRQPKCSATAAQNLLCFVFAVHGCASEQRMTAQPSQPLMNPGASGNDRPPVAAAARKKRHPLL